MEQPPLEPFLPPQLSPPPQPASAMGQSVQSVQSGDDTGLLAVSSVVPPQLSAEGVASRRSFDSFAAEGDGAQW